jgi:glycosyltransferase involved in cell wall biosynthesis
VLAYDVVFNRETLGDRGWFFDRPATLARLLEEAEARPDTLADAGRALRERARTTYDWDDVTSLYEDLALRLAAGETIRGRATGRRARAVASHPSVVT